MAVMQLVLSLERIRPIAISSSLALFACGQPPAPTDSSAPETEAEAFAARIHGPNAQQPSAAAAPPQIAVPLNEAAQGTCSETQLGIYLGRVANAPTRAEIASFVAGRYEVKFIRPGKPYRGSEAPPLKVIFMLDTQDIIRDVRCG